MTLDSGSKHILRLAVKDADAEGWATVSKVVWPLLAKIPDELLEKRPSDDGGHVRLTDTGDAVLRYS
jgi:hypothetical protein